MLPSGGGVWVLTPSLGPQADIARLLILCVIMHEIFSRDLRIRAHCERVTKPLLLLEGLESRIGSHALLPPVGIPTDSKKGSPPINFGRNFAWFLRHFEARGMIAWGSVPPASAGFHAVGRE